MRRLSPSLRCAGCRWLAAPVVALVVTAVLGEDSAKPAPEPTHPATREELWVPTKDLDHVLQGHPNAVILTPAQYESLIRDAGRMKPEKEDITKLPATAVVESVRLHGKVDPSATQVKLSGEILVRSITDDWSTAEVEWPWRTNGFTSEAGLLLSDVAGDVAVHGKPVGRTRMLHLLVHGKGGHRVQFETLRTIESDWQTAESGIGVYPASCPTVMELELPAGHEITSAPAFERSGNRFRISLSGRAFEELIQGAETAPKQGDGKDLGFIQRVMVRWRDVAASAAPSVRVLNEAKAAVQIDGSATAVQWTQTWRARGGGDFRIRLGDPAVTVESVTGDGVLGWSQDGAQVVVRWNAKIGESAVQVRLVVPAKAESTRMLPIPLPEGAQAFAVTADLSLGEGIELLEISGAQRTAPLQFRFEGGVDQPALKVRTAKSTVVASQETQAKLDKDSLSIGREILLVSDKPLTEQRITLPEGEEFIGVTLPGDPAGERVEWKRVGQGIELRWKPSDQPRMAEKVTLLSRIKLAKAWLGPGNPEQIVLEDVTYGDVARAAGRVALQFDDAWRVTPGAMTGLESTTARTSAVPERMAWSALRGHRLTLKVERARPVFDAEIIAYALPRLSTVEIEGQVMLRIPGAPLRSFTVQWPVAVAKLVRFTSPLVGEQTLDGKTGIWTLTLRQELKGVQPVRFRLSLPAQVGQDKIIRSTLPAGAVPASRRFSGIWVVEANTDTELSFETRALQPVDVLHVPTVDGYAPRHRIVAAFGYGSGGHELKLQARRHEHSELATLVVNQLTLDSVLSPDGSSMHDATIHLRHSGEQFVHVLLPKDARLLSTMVEHAAVKPVRTAEGAISVPLPAGSANKPSVMVQVVYALTGEPWSGSGRRHLQPAMVAGDVPVVSTQWTVHAPQGYTYHADGTTLTLDDEKKAGSLWDHWRPWEIWSGIFSPVLLSARRPVETRAMPTPAFEPPEMPAAPEMRKKADDLVDVPPAGGSHMMEKAKSIILPKVQLRGVSIEQALEYLRTASREQDAIERDPAKKGISIVLKAGDVPNDSKITLDLKNVPLVEALRYVTELAGMKFNVEPHAIVVVPITELSSELYTRVYKLPPDFLSTAGASGYANAPADPFAAAPPAQAGAGLIRRRSALDILKDQGIPFPEGATAVFNSVTSELIVKSTQPNLDLVNTLVDTVGSRSVPMNRADKSGLMPLELEIPKAGAVLRFSGSQNPESIELGYQSWERQLAWASVFMALGIGLFVWIGRRRAIVSTLGVVVLFSFGAPLLLDRAMPLANAFFTGWLAAFKLWLIWAVLAWLWRKVERGGSAAAPNAQAAALIALLGLMWSASAATADESKKPAPDPATHQVIVPYDPALPLDQQAPQRYYLDYDAFQKLWNDSKENRRPALSEDVTAEPVASIHTALYKARITPDGLMLDVRLQATSRGLWAKVPITFHRQNGEPAKDKAETSIAAELRVDGVPAVTKDGMVQLEKPGTHVIEAAMAIPVGRDWRELTFKGPASVAGVLQIEAPLSEGWPEVNGFPALSGEDAGNGRVFTASLGSQSVIQIKRYARGQVAASGEEVPAAAVRVSMEHRQFQPDAFEAEMAFQFPGATRRSVSLTLGKGWEIDDLKARAVSDERSGYVMVRRVSRLPVADGGMRLVVELTRELADGVRLVLSGTRSGATAGSTRATPSIKPAAKRVTAETSLLHDANVEIEVRPAPGQTRLADDASERLPEGMMSAGRFRLAGGVALSYDLRPARVLGAATVECLFQVGPQKVEQFAALVLRRKLGNWVDARVAIPDGYEVQNVTGAGVSAWQHEGGTVHLHFDPSRMASAQEAKVLLHLIRSEAQPSATWTLVPVKVEGFERVSGSAIVAAHQADELTLPGFQRTADFDEVDPRRLPATFEVKAPLERKRAVKFEREDWSLNVALARKPVRFVADGTLLAQATPAGLLLSQHVAFTVEQGALDRVKVRLPAALPEAVVKGEALRDVQSKLNGTVREYECTFQSEMLDRAALSFDIVLPTSGEIDVPFVEVAGAERLRRFFVLDNSSDREMKTQEAKNVEPCAKTVPPFIPETLTAPKFYTGRGAEAGALKLAFQELQATEGNAAIITLADISSVWRADGERWDTVVYSIFNRSLQFLPVILPEAAELIAVSVGGEPVRADQEERGGKLARLVPLIQTRVGQRSLEVKLVYRIKPGEAGKGLPAKLRMDDPELSGISAERTVWTASVPKGWVIQKVDGNMEEIAEESRVAERLQGWASDLARINRALKSGEYGDAAEGGQALEEAEKLYKLIDVEAKRVEDDNNAAISQIRRFDNVQTKEESKKSLQLQGRVEADLRNLKQEMAKQQIVLNENRIQQPIFKGKDLAKQGSAQTLGNTWAMNGAPSFPKASGVPRSRGDMPSDPFAAAPTAESAKNIVVTENVAVQGDFVQGLAGMDTAGAGTLVINEGTTVYSGATTISGGSLRGFEKNVQSIGGSTAGRQMLEGKSQSAALPSAGAAPAKTSSTPAVPPPPIARIAEREIRRAMVVDEPTAREGDTAAGVELQQVASQLRPTGRRSLMIDVPADGTVTHYRKLKDHAVLELTVRKEWDPRKTHRAIALGVGLLVWLGVLRWGRRKARPGQAMTAAV